MLFLQVYPLFNDVHTQQFAGWSTIRTAKAVVEFQIALWLSMKFSYNLIIWSVSILVSFVSDRYALGGYIYNLRPRTRSKGCVRSRSHHAAGQNVVCPRSSPLSQAALAMVAALEKSSLVQFGLRQIHLAWASLNRCELIFTASQHFLRTYVAHEQCREAFSTEAKNVHQSHKFNI